MRRRPIVRCGLAALALLAGTVLPAAAGSIFNKSPAADTSCHARAIKDLELFSPRGAQVFHALTDRSMFWPFLTCDNVALGLSTAVHEGVHGLTEQLDGYPLIHGGVLKRPHEVERFVAPRVIAARFPRTNIFVQNYLMPGGASSADTLMYLLDELNAYTHDLHTSVRIRTLPGGNQEVDHRDGLTSLMRFLMHYADEARANHPATWQGLSTPRVRTVVRTLWSQAEKTLASACGIPRFGGEDHRYVAEICDPSDSAALASILDRPVACARECLRAPSDNSDEPRYEVADAGGAYDTASEAASISAPVARRAENVARRAERATRRSQPASRLALPASAGSVAPVLPPVTGKPARSRWPVVVTRSRTVPVRPAPITVAAAASDTAARFASPVILVPRLVAAPILIRNIE